MSTPGDWPLVSVIVPVHNGERFLADALASVGAQAYVPLEVIVVDDGSTDDTPALLAGLGDQVRVVQQAQQGPAAARNHGLRLALGKLVAFLDADDTWPSGMLRRLVAYLMDHPDIDIAQGLVQQLRLDPTALAPVFEETSEPYQFINLGSAIYRRDVFARVGDFDAALWENEDTDWFFRAWEAGVTKAVLPEVALYYRKHDDNLSRAHTDPQRGLVRLFKRHLDRVRAGVSAPTTGRPPISEYIGVVPKTLPPVWPPLPLGEGWGEGLPPHSKAQDPRPGGEGTRAGASAMTSPSPDVQVRLGRVWRRQGKMAQAIASFRRVLAESPDYAPAYVELAGALRDAGRAGEAVAVCRQGLAVAPNAAELHKSLVNALIAAEGLDAVFREYRLTRADDRPVAIAPGDVLACVVARNEAARLPFFLDYYRRLGVARFLVVDNGSTDATPDLLATQPDVTVWRSDLAFSRANFGAGWFEPLLRAHGVGHWTLIVDADEMLVYPDCETRPLPALCADLTAAGQRALDGVLLDMYSDRPIRDTHYAPGEDPRRVCPYFDRQFYHAAYAEWSPYRNQTTLVGGVRQRVFGAGGNYVISKAPLLRYDTDVTLIGGQHWTSLPAEQIAERGCALLHFKYMSAFPDYVRQEMARKEHFGAAMQYAEYARGLAEQGDLTLYDAAHSVRYRDSRQLVELGVIRANDSPQEETTEVVTLDIPRIAPLAADTERPFWSVMLTAYDRTAYLARALRSVLAQADADMQIEVVNDGADAATQAELAALVAGVGGGRVTFTALPRNVGHPHIFNVCVERARGRWVHLLHDDDWVAPGFYAALRAGIESAPDVGMALCRHVRVDEAGVGQWESWLERETPGVIDGWLERIALTCRVQFAAAVVRRDVFETLGGFATGVGSTFDWDMWKRIAARYPVWYEPRPLAFFCQGPLSLTHGLLRSGGQVADTRRSIEASHTYLPPAVAADLTRRAADQCAVYALDVARRYLRAGDRDAAAANAREGLRAARSAQVRAALRDALTRAGQVDV